MDPFLFLGHGEGPGRFDVTVCLADPSADPSVAVEALKRLTKRITVQATASVIRFEAQLKRAPRLHEELSHALEGLHAAAPIALVVRENRVKPSAWHERSLREPARLLEVLERQVRARAGTPYGPGELTLSDELSSVHQAAWDDLRFGATLASLIQTSLSLVTKSLKPRSAAAQVWHDLLVTHLPSWTGVDFAVDLAVLEQLSKTQAVAPTTIEMPGHFKDAFDALVRGRHKARSWRTSETKVDWTRVDAVRAAMGRQAFSELQSSLDDTSDAHVQTLLALSHEERVELSRHGRLATVMMNAATMRMMAGDFATALRLYDSALEGNVEAAAAANPLYAVADDNNHLGVDAARARRYLEKCLPFGAKNPGVFLNGACLVAELGDADETLRLLGLAKQHGYLLKNHRNEGVFAFIRARAEFKRLMA